MYIYLYLKYFKRRKSLAIILLAQIVPFVLSEAVGTRSATARLSPSVATEGDPHQPALWGESDSINSFAKGKTGCSHWKHLSDLELVLERVSLTAWVKVGWKDGGLDCIRAGHQGKGCSERRKTVICLQFILKPLQVWLGGCLLARSCTCPQPPGPSLSITQRYLLIYSGCTPATRNW